jgi:hypothetical protein
MLSKERFLTSKDTVWKEAGAVLEISKTAPAGKEHTKLRAREKVKLQ